MVLIEEIDHKPYYREHPLVQKAISDLQGLLGMNQSRIQSNKPPEIAEKQVKPKGREQVL